MTEAAPFWETTALEKMSTAQWESLCDGCGLCCTQVLEDEDTGAFQRLAVSCRLLDTDSCRCLDYENRFDEVPGCVRVTPELARTAEWLPASCGYRRVARGEALSWWHPLVSGQANSVHESGVSVRGRVVSEEFVDDDEAWAFVLEG